MASRPIYHYHYWSKRLTEELADEVRINPIRRWNLTLASRIPLLGVEIRPQKLSPRMDELAERLEATGLFSEFTGTERFRSTPYFVSGTGDMAFMRSLVGTKRPKGSSMYTCKPIAEDLTVHICLFGSISNFIGYRSAAKGESDFCSSAYWAIQELLDSRGVANSSKWDDEERAFEAVKWALYSRDYPKLRFGKLIETEWCAQIYSDVTPTPGRWNATPTPGEWIGDLEQRTGRILVGAPLWVRTVLDQL